MRRPKSNGNMPDHTINGEQWVRQFIAKVLHITHSQRIFRNFTLHDKQQGCLRRKEMNGVLDKIEKPWETEIEDVPNDSRLLLELDFDQLVQSGIHNKTY